jgi:hypothetical protein
VSDSSEFDNLVKQLEGVLAEQARMGVGYSLPLAERRMRIERELIGLLQPGYLNAERRRSVRVPCRLGGRLRTTHGPINVVVTNVGCGGAGIEADRELEPNSEIELEILMGPGSRGEIHARFGQISWVKGKSAGIAFEPGTEPLDQHILRFILSLLKRR